MKDFPSLWGFGEAWGIHQKLNGTESQRTPKEGTKVMRYSGLEVRSLGPVGDFLDLIVGLIIKGQGRVYP